MRFIGYSWVLIFTAVMMGCSSVKVSTDHDKNTDFSNFKSYQWIDVKTDNNKDAIEVDAIMDARIRNTINQQLALQGYKKVAENADLQLNYSVLTQDKTDIRTYNTYSGYPSRWGWRGGYGYRGMGMGSSDTVIKTYQSGTLVIDFVDPASNKLVWRGLGSERLPEEKTSEIMDSLVKKVVESVLNKFPPK